MISIVKKELHQFFSSLTGYITIILFLLVNGLYLFVLKDSNIFDFGYATLDKFFDLSPWIFIFLIPALAMRSLSEEYKTGTFEILQTRPAYQMADCFRKIFRSILRLLLLHCFRHFFMFILFIPCLRQEALIAGELQVLISD